MKRKEKVEELLDFQKKVELDFIYSEIQEIFLKVCQQKLKEILNRDDVEPFLKEIIQQDYDDFIKIWLEIVEEKGGDASLEFAKIILPTNLWIKIIEKSPPKSSEKLENTLNIELLEAKRKNQIN